MIIKFIKQENFYDDLESELYGSTTIKTIYYNFTPIEINEQHYILTSSKNLEGYLMDYNNDVKIKLYIEDENNKNIMCIKLQLKNIVTFGSKINSNKSNNCTEPDCYIDLLCNLLLIKFHSSKLNYIKINNDLNCIKDLKYEEEEINLKYIWKDENFESKKIYTLTKIYNIWNDKYINLPHIPLILNPLIPDNNLYPITGSPVYDEYNNFLGMVSYVNQNEIITIPLISIKKIYDYLFGSNILYLGLDIIPIKLDFKIGLSNINYNDGLLITNNYYNNLLNTIKKIEQNQKKIEQNQSEQNQSEQNQNCFLDIINDNNTIQKTTNYVRLKKGNIICSIDNYNINSEGNIIIEENDLLSVKEKKYKLIPFKSYIWLFKNSINNQINLKIISHNNYKLKLSKKIQYENEKLKINDSNIMKKIKLIESIITIKTEYNSVSQFDISELKYIKYNSIKLLELNEKILEIIKQLLFENQTTYSYIINNIFNDKYTYINKKIMLLFNFNEKKLPTITIITKDIINFEDILYKYKTNDELKKFLVSQV